jgi:hypothetical protein
LAWRAGSNEFRFGTNSRIFRLNDYDFGEGVVPLVTYTTLPQFIYGVAWTASETFPLANSQPYNFPNLDFYAQDTWKVARTLTWTFGVRDTYNSNPLNPPALWDREGAGGATRPGGAAEEPGGVSHVGDVARGYRGETQGGGRRRDLLDIEEKPADGEGGETRAAAVGSHSVAHAAVTSAGVRFCQGHPIDGPFIIQKVLGHSQLSTTKRYTHVPMEVTKTAVTGLESLFAGTRKKPDQKQEADAKPAMTPPQIQQFTPASASPHRAGRVRGSPVDVGPANNPEFSSSEPSDRLRD